MMLFSVLDTSICLAVNFDMNKGKRDPAKNTENVNGKDEKQQQQRRTKIFTGKDFSGTQLIGLWALVLCVLLIRS